MAHLLTEEGTHPLTAARFLTKRYGLEWFQWPPSVLRQTLQADEAVNISRRNMTRALAAAAVAMRDEFWTEWQGFHFLCQALNGIPPDPGLLHAHSLAEMLVAVDVAQQVRRELKGLAEMPEFSEEVARYVACQALAQGIWYLPPPLDFANKYAARRRYRCLDCGAEQEVFDDDGLCDACTGRFDTEHLGRWESDPAALARGLGKNTQVFEGNPQAAVAARLVEVLSRPGLTLQENSTDVCVARIIPALSALYLDRAEMRVQEALT